MSAPTIGATQNRQSWPGAPSPLKNATAVGTPEQIVEKLPELTNLGLDYGIFHFPEIATDTSGLELVERDVIPALG